MSSFDPSAGFQVWALQARTDAAGDPIDDSTAAEGRLAAELVTPGVMRPSNGYVAAQRAAGANMSVDVGSGSAFTDLACVQGNEPGQGRYLIRLGDGVTNVTVDAADVSNPRIDQVFLVVFEHSLDSSGRTMARFFVRKGTPGSSPSAPGPDGAWTAYLLLANITVGAGATEIVNANIADQRAMAGADLAGAAMVPTGGIIDYVGAGVPAGWLQMDGGTYSQATYQNLWQVAGPAGSGVLTDAGGGNFTMPDTRRRFRIGQGSGLALGAVGGAFDHVHTGPSHAHSGPSHVHTGPSHTHLMTAHQHNIPFPTRSTSGSSAANTGSGGSHGHSTGGPSTTTVTALGGQSVADFNHTHSVNSAGAHTHSMSHTHTVDEFLFVSAFSGGADPTGASGTGNTGAAGTGNTGASGTGNTGTNNPPFLAVTTLIKH